MKPKTLKALRGSIAKWKRIEAGIEEDRGPANCPLCKLFYEGGCSGCPVDLAGFQYCGGSPYQDWYVAALVLETWRATTPQLVKLARAERKFLESLLPKKKGKK